MNTIKHGTKRLKCSVCGREKPQNSFVPAENVRPEIGELIDEDHPGWREAGYVCRDDLLKYRRRYVNDMLLKERSELSELDHAVIASIAKHGTLTEDVETTFRDRLSPGDLWADRIASFGGSWTFIGLFGLVLFGWIGLNLSILFANPFDPYPFILLNLVLSCIAAVQAPLIMMSQRRQEAKDRLRSQNDYRVNLKAELEIRLLHEKLDHLLLRQWERLTEIQQIQLELMEEIAQDRRQRP
jgi:uncharacterized membrane protein